MHTVQVYVCYKYDIVEYGKWSTFTAKTKAAAMAMAARWIKKNVTSYVTSIQTTEGDVTFWELYQ